MKSNGIAARAVAGVKPLQTHPVMLRTGRADTLEHDFKRGEAPLIPMSFPRGAAWHVIYTAVKMEARVALDLRSKGFDVFMPVAKKWIRHARYKKEVTYPVFARYLFVAFDIERDEWFHPIMSADGVEDLLRNNQVPCRVPAKLIEDLKECEDMGLFDETSEVSRLEAGSEVRIVRGAFADVIAKLKDASDKKRVEVLLPLLGGTVVKLPLADLRRA